jgi:hypothetical protein
VERDKPKNKMESIGQTLLQLPWKQKKGITKFVGFLSSNFMKLCRNIHRSVRQLLGVEKIQNGGRCHGNQGAKNVIKTETVQRTHLKLDTKIDHHSKLSSLF